MKPKSFRSRAGARKLPRHIRENLKHPALRQAWALELGLASARFQQRQPAL